MLIHYSWIITVGIHYADDQRAYSLYTRGIDWNSKKIDMAK